jgi:hypothetical protein
MRISKEALSISVLVRRVRVGAAPFGWEIHRDGASGAIYASPERYVSMAEAYQAGQARLPEFVSRRAAPSDSSQNHQWQLPDGGFGDHGLTA